MIMLGEILRTLHVLRHRVLFGERYSVEVSYDVKHDLYYITLRVLLPKTVESVNCTRAFSTKDKISQHDKGIVLDMIDEMNQIYQHALARLSEEQSNA